MKSITLILQKLNFHHISSISRSRYDTFLNFEQLTYFRPTLVQLFSPASPPLFSAPVFTYGRLPVHQACVPQGLSHSRCLLRCLRKSQRRSCQMVLPPVSLVSVLHCRYDRQHRHTHLCQRRGADILVLQRGEPRPANSRDGVGHRTQAHSHVHAPQALHHSSHAFVV